LHDNLCVCFVINIRELQEPSAFEVETAFGNVNRHKSPGIDENQA